MKEDLVIIDTKVVIVRYRDGVDYRALEGYGVIGKDFPGPGCLFLTLHDRDKGEQLPEILQIPGVIGAEYNVRTSARNRMHSVPVDRLKSLNDPIYNEMGLPQAWDITKGDPRVKIAVIDSGVDMNHPDINCKGGRVTFDHLEATNGDSYPMRIYVPGLVYDFSLAIMAELDGWAAFKWQPGIYTIQSSDPGWSSLVPAVFYTDPSCTVVATQAQAESGWVWINEPVSTYAYCYPTRSSAWVGTFGRLEMWDDWGHGTAIVGLITAPHNDNGLCGIAPDCTTYAYKFVDDYYAYSSTGMINAVMQAVEDGCHVLSCSFGGPIMTQAEQDVFAYAMGQGSVPVAACGNRGYYWNQDVDSDALDYPSALDSVIGVGACGWTNYTVANTDGMLDMPTTKLDFARLCSFTQKFPQVDLVAPGYGWIFHAPTDFSEMWLYYQMSTHARYYTFMGDGGTSFSCPAVAAAAGLCMSRYLAKYSITAPDIPLSGVPWTFNQVKGWLTSTAKTPVKLSNGNPATKGFGSGRLDAYAAVMAV